MLVGAVLAPGVVVGVVGGGVGQDGGPVDQGVGQGVPGDGFAVGADGMAEQVAVGDAVFAGPGEGGDDGRPVGVLHQRSGGTGPLVHIQVAVESGDQLGQPRGA